MRERIRRMLSSDDENKFCAERQIFFFNTENKS